MYKTTDGKPENLFAFEGQPQDAFFTIELLSELTKQYCEACHGGEAERKGDNKKLWVGQKTKLNTSFCFNKNNCFKKISF